MTAMVLPPSGEFLLFSASVTVVIAPQIISPWNQLPLTRMATISGHASVHSSSVEILVKLMREDVDSSACVQVLSVSMIVAKHLVIFVETAFLDTGGTKKEKNALVSKVTLEPLFNGHLSNFFVMSQTSTP